ncbi:M16 family metallopeptidase [Luteococcus japonicus]|uniref:Zinc protease n=1 Tax=Luteococcus japonicus LSP_Lj1 TaxID=1255658 RepID=A0A1R4JVV5_9ACTN|nr:pitrilysin family protein [Luteococcus japonicus]SJN36230.1 zinc protease [Luteococcus japonicus LSP_Lj1]
MPQALTLQYTIEERTLPNGLRVVVNPDPSSPAVAVNLWYHVGSADEVAGRSGFAHLFEHLMFQGSARVASGEHLSALQAVGGHVNATTSFDRTNYFETVPPGAVDLALWLEADRLASLDVSQQNLDNQREVVKEEKRQRYDNVPYGDQLHLLLALNFPTDHPYGHTTIGAMEDLDAASLDEVRDFFATWYRASNAVLTLAGAIERETAFTLAEKYFGELPALPAPERHAADRLPPHEGLPRLEVVRDVPRPALHLGWRTPSIDHHDHLAVEQALAILAGGPSSRLHKVMVRETGTTEGVGGSQFDLAQGSSLALVSARTRQGHGLDELETQIVDQIQQMADEGVSAEELDRANASYEREWLGELAQIDSRADQLGAFATLHGDATQLNEHLRLMLDVTPEDVQAAVRTWLAPEARSILYYNTQTPEPDTETPTIETPTIETPTIESKEQA